MDKDDRLRTEELRQAAEAAESRSNGIDAETTPSLSERPCFRVFGEWVEDQNGKLRPGVWFFGIKQGKKAEDPATLTQQWVCSPLHIDAVTEDGQDNNFGRLLRFKNTLGRWHEWAMPMELLRGLGDELRGELLAMGVEINPQSKILLGQYLQSVRPKARVRCAMQVGWCGNSFVLPDAVRAGCFGRHFPVRRSPARRIHPGRHAGRVAIWDRGTSSRQPSSGADDLGVLRRADAETLRRRGRRDALHGSQQHRENRSHQGWLFDLGRRQFSPKLESYRERHGGRGGYEQ
jgi:Domain of unknown function (DUF927)